jgi:hypothetical protein
MSSRRVSSTVSITCCPYTGLTIPECSCRHCCLRLIEHLVPKPAGRSSTSLPEPASNRPPLAAGPELQANAPGGAL